MWKLQAAPQKSHPLFPSNLPLKIKVLPSPPPPPFWKFGWRLNSPQQKGAGAHYVVAFFEAT